MQNQSHLFSLDSSLIFINAAYMSPQLREVAKAGQTALLKMNNPGYMSGNDFFRDRIVLKKKFAQLIHAPDFNNIAIIPSVSYGIANAAANIKLKSGDEIIVVDEQFPSNFYSWREIANKNNAEIKIISPPLNKLDRGKNWNISTINAINKNTKIVAIAHVHWADGTLFDLKTISKKCKEVGSKLIIDGSQSVGALEFDIESIKPDVLICAGYKWLMGPYSIGLAYYADEMCNGEPIEQNWINRLNSDNFKNLTKYQSEYKPKAERYSVGESSNFILVPMMIAAIDQLLLWGQENIQSYCKSISNDGIKALKQANYWIEDEAYRGHHLLGIYLPDTTNKEKINKTLQEHKVIISHRGDAIRVSPHVYNTKKEFEIFVDCLLTN